MLRLRLPLALLSLAALAACSGSSGMTIENTNGKAIGTVKPESEHVASVLNNRGEVRAKIRGNVVRDESGKHIGTIQEKDGNVVILDAQSKAVGSMSNGTDCYGKGKDVLGYVRKVDDHAIAAGACLVFFLQ